MKRNRSVKALDSSAIGMLRVMKLICLMTFALLVGVSANAAPGHSSQSSQKTLTGKVTDTSGTALPGVSVFALGTSAGVSTGADGTFSITVPGDAQVLEFSFLGMQTQEVEIGSRTTFNITMENDDIQISELVVVGYGTMSRRDISTSVASVSSEALNDRTSAFNINQSLDGKIAGVQSITASGKPGGGSTLRIRGMGSVNAGNDPIYVLDGVVGVNPDIINSANVESIEVLKDAAATAMYGSQGANGVVLITTKRGKKGEGVITYDSKVGVSFLNRRMDLLNAEEYMEVQERAYAYSGRIAPHLDPMKPLENLFYYKKDASGNFEYDDYGRLIASPKYDTDWQKAVTQRAVTNDQHISFSNATDRTSIYASVGLQDYQGLVRETYSNRLSGTVNVNSKVNDWLSIQAVATVGSQKGNDMEGGFGQGPIRNMTEMPPIIPIHYEDGTWGRKGDYPLSEDGENPILLLRDQKKKWDTNFSVFNLRATVNLTKNLEFTAQGDYQITNRKEMNYAKAGLYDVSETNGGYADLKSLLTKKMASENYFTYNNRWFDNQLSSNFVLGTSLYYTYYEDFSSGSEQYFDDFFDYHNLGAGTTWHEPTSTMWKNTMNSYYFRMNHSFRDKYLLGFTFRADGASNFGKNNKYGYFPSASAAWRISEEGFFEGAKKVVNNMKIRLSYGAVGNASIPNYRTISQYRTGTTYFGNGGQSYVVLDNLGDPNLKWESSNQFNAGLDVSFLNNRLELIVDAYYKTTKDLLFEKQVPYTTGYETTWTNLGKIANRGLEVTISSRNIHNRDFMWTTDLVFSTNRIIVKDVNGETIDTGNNTIAREGEKWAAYNVYRRLGTWGLHEVEEAARYGKKPGDLKYEDVNDDGVIDEEDLQIMGSGTPKGHISMINTLHYKGFTFMVDLNMAYGFKIMGIAPAMMENRPLYSNNMRSILNAWTPENQNTMIAALRLPSDPNFGENEKDSHMLQKGDFLRIRNIAISYDFNPKWFANQKIIKGISLGVSVENPWVFSKYTGFDPEVVAFGADRGQSIDFYAYPHPTTVSANLKIVF